MMLQKFSGLKLNDENEDQQQLISDILKLYTSEKYGKIKTFLSP